MSFFSNNTFVTKERTSRRHPAEQPSRARNVFVSLPNGINTQRASCQMPAPSFSDNKWLVRVNNGALPLRCTLHEVWAAAWLLQNSCSAQVPARLELTDTEAGWTLLLASRAVSLPALQCLDNRKACCSRSDLLNLCFPVRGSQEEGTCCLQQVQAWSSL